MSLLLLLRPFLDVGDVRPKRPATAPITEKEEETLALVEKELKEAPIIAAAEQFDVIYKPESTSIVATRLAEFSELSQRLSALNQYSEVLKARADLLEAEKEVQLKALAASIYAKTLARLELAKKILEEEEEEALMYFLLQ
jgi:hypothetical protein